MQPRNPGRWFRYFCILTPNFLLRRLAVVLRGFSFIRHTKETQTPITFDMWYAQKILGHNRSAPWPVHFTSRVFNWKNIITGIDTSPGYSPGNYISAIYGEITIGNYTQIGPNVAIIADNHNVYDTREHISKDVVIGSYCWIGFGAIILPGVVLGDFTIVAAGSVVTRSFPEGYCVIGGNVAAIIKKLDTAKCKKFENEYKYVGYYTFDDYSKLMEKVRGEDDKHS